MLDGVSDELFGMDPRIMSVGIGLVAGGHGLRVVRRRDPQVRPLRGLDARVQAEGLRGIPLEVVDVDAPIVAQVKIAAPQASSSCSAHARAPQPLGPGSQLQNWDCDERAGLFTHAQIEIGSLGAIIEDDQGALLLSNNHVLAGQNRGQRGDRIASPGGETLDEREVVARLERFVSLRPSPVGAHPRWGNVVWNEVDAAVARIVPGLHVSADAAHGGVSGPPRNFASGAPVPAPELGDVVFKVGVTTGLTRGRIVGVGDRVGPVIYGIGDCWFRRSFSIETEDGQPFSDAGDSGAAVVRSDGALLGLVYAGNGVQSYACPMAAVLEHLAVSPAT
jgi:hypothetical protein